MKRMMSLLSCNKVIFLICFLLLLEENVVIARPVVRNIRSTHEFDRLLKKHTEETGLPIVVDFYSDSCGPCRMMAPIFKKVASSVQDEAVFVKIDTNAQYELSARYQIRSLPTFMFFYGSTKPHSTATGGIGEENLRQRTRQLITQAQIENVLLELEDFQAYYKDVDPNKSEEEVVTLYKKCAGMGKGKSGQQLCQGAAANQLIRRLKKKYKSAPTTQKRFQPQSKKTKDNDDDAAAGGDADKTSKKNRFSSRTSGNAKSNDPNLHLATKEQLMEELEKRLDEERDQQVEDEAEDEEEQDPSYRRWTPSDFPERVVIVGGGPAGMAAAIYAARAALQPLVIAPSMGGQLQGKGVDVENYPGVHNVTGPAVIASMRSQAATFGAYFEDDFVTSVDVSTKPITVKTNETGTIQTHTLIVATGAESKWLGIPGEYDMRGGGVSSCATCDGFLFSGKDVVIVGGGDAAMEDALVLARTSKSVTLIHRRDTFRASKILSDRVINHPSIHIRWNTTVQEILGKTIVIGDDEQQQSNQQQKQQENIDLDDQEEQEAVVDLDSSQKVVTGVILRDETTNQQTQFNCDAVFIAIGHTPSTSFLEGVVQFDPHHAGYILTDGQSTRTSVEGIFAAGDVADSIYRQAITSAGSGAAAALDAERYLSENGLGNEAALFEAELLAELMGDTHDNTGEEQIGYNVYDDASSSKVGIGVKETFAAEF